jgi:hypothetical protein
MHACLLMHACRLVCDPTCPRLCDVSISGMAQLFRGSILVLCVLQLCLVCYMVFQCTNLCSLMPELTAALEACLLYL